MDKGFAEGKTLLCGNYTAYTPSGAQLFKNKKRWGIIPHVGDIVYFYTTKLKRISHVGAVVSVNKVGDYYNISTIEGNTSNDNSFCRNGGCVAIKTYSFTLAQVGGNNRINGFGTPVFGENTCTVQEFITELKNNVGYYEKETNAYLDQKTKNIGDKNYTMFGKWYSEIVNDKIYLNGQWCQMFISYVAFMSCKHHNGDINNINSGWINGNDKDGNFWVYRKDGKNVHGWAQIKSRWYHFGDDGKMTVGWYTECGKWYYFKETSGMVAGIWLELDGKWYYFHHDGSAYMGEWLQYKGDYYYFHAVSGEMVTKRWIKDKDKWYYIGDDGKMVTNDDIWYEKEKAYCHVNESGEWDGIYKKVDEIYKRD